MAITSCVSSHILNKETMNIYQSIRLNREHSAKMLLCLTHECAMVDKVICFLQDEVTASDLLGI